MKNLYEILGVSPDASKAVIREAYKRAAMKHHPDRGGDKVAFQAIQHAYDVLSDRERRAHYDATGATERELTPEEKREQSVRSVAQQMLRGTLVKILTVADEKHDNILAAAAQSLHGVLTEATAGVQQLLTKKGKAEEALRRLTDKGADQVLTGTLKGLIDALVTPLETVQLEADSATRALELLETGEYQVDERPEPTFQVKGNMNYFYSEADIARIFGSGSPFGRPR